MTTVKSSILPDAASAISLQSVAEAMPASTHPRDSRFVATITAWSALGLGTIATIAIVITAITLP